MAGGRPASVETLDTGMIHVLDRTEWESTRFHHPTENVPRPKIYELFISGTFRLIFWSAVDSGELEAGKVKRRLGGRTVLTMTEEIPASEQKYTQRDTQ